MMSTFTNDGSCCVYWLSWSMFPSSFVCFWASSGDTGMYSSADILRRELYSFCSCYVLRQYTSAISSWRNMWNVQPFSIAQPKQRNLVSRASRLPSIFLAFILVYDVIFHISQTSSKFGKRLLVMKNGPRDSSQSETEIFLEWIINHLSLGKRHTL